MRVRISGSLSDCLLTQVSFDRCPLGYCVPDTVANPLATLVCDGQEMTMDTKDAAAGFAALAICESLLLALSDLKIMAKKEADGVLEDAAAAHRDASASTQDAAMHFEVVNIIDRIIAGGNSISR